MRVVLRKDRLDHRNKVRANQSHSQVDRVMWFRHAVPEEVPTLTREEHLELIEEYLSRYNEEYESLLALHRPGKVRPKAAREDMLALFIANERQEYASGFGKDMDPFFSIDFMFFFMMIHASCYFKPSSIRIYIMRLSVYTDNKNKTTSFLFTNGFFPNGN